MDWDKIFQSSSDELDGLLINRSYVLTFNNYDVTLSKMEIKTLIQLIRGQHAGEIAQALNIKQSTVESYLFNIKNKLGISRKSQLIAEVASSNLLNQIRI